MRVSGKYLVIALPNNWNAARVPIARDRGTFAHYGLPADKPMDRHKWFFSLADALNFINEHISRRGDPKLLEMRVCEKPRPAVVRLLRRLRRPVQINYLIRYSHTGWFALGKNT